MKEQKIGIGIPTIALKKMGKIEGDQKVSEFVEKFLSGMEDIFDDEQKKEMEEFRPYLANLMFLPCVITKMIDQNITFADAVKASEEEINKTILKITELYDLFMHDAQFMEQFNKMCSGIFEAMASAKKEHNSKEKEYRVEIVFTLETIMKIASTGIFTVINKLAESDELKMALENDFEKPVKAAVCNILKEKQEEYHIDEEDYLASLDEVDSLIENLKATLTIGNVLTVVFKKAINEDMTFTEAAKSFNDEELYNDSIERFKLYNDFKQVKAVIEKMFNVGFEFLEEM